MQSAWRRVQGAWREVKMEKFRFQDLEIRKTATDIACERIGSSRSSLSRDHNLSENIKIKTSLSARRFAPREWWGSGAMESPRTEEGFTLMEILIVITILGILASVIAVKIMDRPGQARAVKARLDIETLGNALKLFKLDNAFYPSTDQGLRALVEIPSTGRIPRRWRGGGYLEKGQVPKDPWGNDYLYLSPGVHNGNFDIWSYGADEEEGGEGEDADVTNWGFHEG